MLRNIAVGINADPASRVPLEQAVALAAATCARLHLLAALEDAFPDVEYLTPSDSDVLRRAALRPLDSEEVEQEELPALPPFLEQARRRCHEGAVRCRVYTHQGEAYPWLAEKGLVGQLLVLGRGRDGSRPHRRPGRTLRALLRAPDLPILACAREVVAPRGGLVLYQPGPVGARTLALAAELCADLNLPLVVLAAAERRETAAHDLREARDALYAYQVDCEFLPTADHPALALLDAALRHNPSLVAVPAQPRGLFSFSHHSACQAALEVPGALALLVP